MRTAEWTNALLDLAYAVTADPSPGDEALWWRIVWPAVQRVERSLRSGLRPAPADELNLLREISAYSMQRSRPR
jgi:hypothetical protein